MNLILVKEFSRESYIARTINADHILCISPHAYNMKHAVIEFTNGRHIVVIESVVDIARLLGFNEIPQKPMVVKCEAKDA